MKILLPILVLGLFNAAPHATRFTASLNQAREARLMGQHRLSAARLNEALVLEPWRVDLWEQIGREELAAGREQEAVQAFEMALKVGVLSADGQLQLGDLYERQENLQAALQTWNGLAARGSEWELDYERAQIYERIYRTQREQANLPGAEAALRAWYAIEPDNEEVSYLLGLLATVTDTVQALPLLQAAAEKDAQYVKPYEVLRRGLGQAAVAEDAGYGWLMIGRALGSLEQWDLAQVAFAKATEAGPDYAEAWAFLGEAQYQTGHSGQEALNKALFLNPDSSLVRALVALDWRRKGKIDLAIAHLTLVARQEPQEAMWQLELGEAWAEKGDLQQARQFFEYATKVAPDSPVVWKQVALFSVTNSLEVKAWGLPAARQYLLLSPNDPAALDLMGWVLLNVEDDISAERFLQRAIDEDARYAAAYLHMGQLYLSRDDSASAYPYLRQAAELGGGQPKHNGLAVTDSVAEIARRLLELYYREGG